MTKAASPLLHLALLALVGVNGYLLAQLVWSDDAPSGHGPAAAWSPDLRAPSAEATSIKPLAMYRATLSQPVLFKSRQPYVPPPPPPPAPKAVEPVAPVEVGFRLGGVIMVGAIKKAFVYRASDPKGMWLSEGEITQGWNVESIESRRAVLRRDGRTLELLLYPPR